MISLGTQNPVAFACRPKTTTLSAGALRFPVVLGRGVVGVQVEPAGVRLAAGSLELDQLGGQRLLRVLLAHVVGVPHQVGVAIDDHADVNS